MMLSSQSVMATLLRVFPFFRFKKLSVILLSSFCLSVIIAQRAASINKVCTTGSNKSNHKKWHLNAQKVLLNTSLSESFIHKFSIELFASVVTRLMWLNATLTNDVPTLNWYRQECTCTCDLPEFIQYSPKCCIKHTLTLNVAVLPQNLLHST